MSHFFSKIMVHNVQLNNMINMYYRKDYIHLLKVIRA